MEGFSLFWIPFCIVIAEGGITMGIVRWMIPLAAAAAAAVGSIFSLVLPSVEFEIGLIPVGPAQRKMLVIIQLFVFDAVQLAYLFYEPRDLPTRTVKFVRVKE